jgi:hypothetical protein
MRVMLVLMNPFDSIRQAPRSFVYGPSQSTIFFETVKREYDSKEVRIVLPRCTRREQSRVFLGARLRGDIINGHPACPQGFFGLGGRSWN